MHRKVTASGRTDYANPSHAKAGQGLKSSLWRTRARHNALKSGLYAKTALLPFEDKKAYAKLRVAIFAECDPQGAVEVGLAELIIADLWRLNRFVWIENEFLEQTRLALTPYPPGPLQTGISDTVQIGNGKTGVSVITECSAHNGIFASSYKNGAEIPRSHATALLDAFICRMSQTPMEDVARQRRCASRELLRNIAALEALQARRQAV